MPPFHVKRTNRPCTRSRPRGGTVKLRNLLPNFILVATLAAFLALTTSALSSQESPKARSLPTVQQVMDHYVSAIGGHDAISKPKSMTVRGKFLVGSDQGLSLDRTVYYKGGK